MDPAPSKTPLPHLGGRPKKIALLLKTNVGGLWALPQLEEIRRRGFDVVAVIPEGEGKLRRRLDDAGFRVRPTVFDFTMSNPLRALRGMAEVRRILNEERVDTVFYHLIASALVGRISTIGLGVRRVHMVPGPLYLENPRIAAIEAILARLDDHVIGGSTYTRDKYAALGFPASRLSAIPYGVDLQRMSPTAGDHLARTELGVGDGVFLVIMVAYVYAPKSTVFPGVGIKGHDTLLEAWSLFTQDHPDSHLVLVGAGFDTAGEEHRRRLMERYKGTGQVTWLETVDDVRPWYAAADLSVSPSLSDNHGAAAEAAALGVPSITSDAGALPEVAPDTGWVVPAGDSRHLADALAAAYREHRAGLLSIRGARARAWAEENFDVTKTSRAVADVVTQTAAAVVVVEQRVASDDGRTVGIGHLTELDGLGEVVPLRIVARGGLGARSGLRELVPGSTGVILPWGGAGDLLRAVFHVVREVRRAPITIVYVPGTVGSLAALAAVALGRPLVSVTVGDPHESLAPPMTAGPTGMLLRRGVVGAMRLACRRAVLCRYVTQEALQRRYPPRRGEVFSAMSVYPLDRPRPTRPAGVSTETLRLLTVASLEQPYKGVAELISVLASLRGDHRFVLRIAGEGRLRPGLERLASDLGLTDRVEFLGHLGSSDLLDAYAESDLFVLNSWTEGLPRALVEAMAAGLPCVATTVGGNAELLLQHALVPPHDDGALRETLDRYLRDPELRGADARRNRLHAEAALQQAQQTQHDFVAAIAEIARARS